MQQGDIQLAGPSGVALDDSVDVGGVISDDHAIAVNEDKEDRAGSKQEMLLSGEEERWNELLSSKKLSTENLKLLTKKQRHFYEEQNELIDNFITPFSSEGSTEEEDLKVKIAINGSLLANMCLFGFQLGAAVSSHSLSLIATTVDSFMDLLCGLIIFMTARARQKRDILKYPTGKARMEPVGIVLFSALMASVSLQLIIEGVTDLINGGSNFKLKVQSIVLVGAAIGTKLILFLYCRVLTHSPSAMTLATDHFNDLLVNGFGITMAILGYYIRWWLDPTGSLLVALIILRSWTMTAYEQIGPLVGSTAPPQLLNKLTFIALRHHPELKVDTCRAFHVGSNFFVEVDIVLPPDMRLIDTHDIGESLQIKLERLPEVERAFVHVDYEFRHKPEHKAVN